MSAYPDEVVLKKGTHVYDFLRKYSDLIKEMTNNNASGDLTLGSWLFGDDTEKWHLFYDTFFPEAQVESVFLFTKDKSGQNIVGVRNPRGSIDALREMFDYLMIDEPSKMNDRIANIAKTHKPYNSGLNTPANTVARGTAPQKWKPGKGAQAFKNKRLRSYLRTMRRYDPTIWGSMNNFNNEYENENENENEGIQVGLTEEEESLREALAPSMRKYVTSNLVSRKAKRTKKTKKMLAKTRRQQQRQKEVAERVKRWAANTLQGIN